MRPLTATLALFAASSDADLRAARHAAHARAADRRPGRHPARARLRRRVPGEGRLSAAARLGRARSALVRRAAQGARRRLQPVPERPAARPAAARRAGRRGDRGRRRADLQALRRDHPEAARGLRHRRRARGHAALSPRRRPAAALARSLRRRGRRVVGVVLHRRGGDRRGRFGAAHRRHRQRLDPGRHRLRRRGAGDGRAHRVGQRLAGSAPRPLAAGARSTSTATPCPTRR